MAGIDTQVDVAVALDAPAPPLRPLARSPEPVSASFDGGAASHHHQQRQHLTRAVAEAGEEGRGREGAGGTLVASSVPAAYEASLAAAAAAGRLPTGTCVPVGDGVAVAGIALGRPPGEEHRQLAVVQRPQQPDANDDDGDDPHAAWGVPAEVGDAVDILGGGGDVGAGETGLQKKRAQPPQTKGAGDKTAAGGRRGAQAFRPNEFAIAEGRAGGLSADDMPILPTKPVISKWKFMSGSALTISMVPQLLASYNALLAARQVRGGGVFFFDVFRSFFYRNLRSCTAVVETDRSARLPQQRSVPLPLPPCNNRVAL